MNNEPVAWMMKAKEPSLHSPDYITFETPTRDMKVSHHPYPLYTQEQLSEGKARAYNNGYEDGRKPNTNPHPVKEQDDYCKAYWGNDNKFVDVFLPNSETEVIRFWNNTHPVKELTDEEIEEVLIEQMPTWQSMDSMVVFAKAILRKAQEK